MCLINHHPETLLALLFSNCVIINISFVIRLCTQLPQKVCVRNNYRLWFVICPWHTPSGLSIFLFDKWMEVRWLRKKQIDDITSWSGASASHRHSPLPLLLHMRPPLKESHLYLCSSSSPAEAAGVVAVIDGVTDELGLQAINRRRRNRTG